MRLFEEERKSALRGSQDTGNPVLDSLVNLATCVPPTWLKPEWLRATHEILLTLYAEEPRRAKNRQK